MKYDIHKFEQLHFLITQTETNGFGWTIAVADESEQADGKYTAYIWHPTNDELIFQEHGNCPIDALALAYQKFKESQDDEPEPALVRTD